MTLATASSLEGVRMDPAQVRLLDDESRVVVVCWHRQKGKDFTSARKAVRHTMKTGEAWYIVSITQRQADETFARRASLATAPRPTTRSPACSTR